MKRINFGFTLIELMIVVAIMHMYGLSFYCNNALSSRRSGMHRRNASKLYPVNSQHGVNHRRYLSTVISWITIPTYRFLCQVRQCGLEDWPSTRTAQMAINFTVRVDRQAWTSRHRRKGRKVYSFSGLLTVTNPTFPPNPLLLNAYSASASCHPKTGGGIKKRQQIGRASCRERV